MKNNLNPVRKATPGRRAASSEVGLVSGRPTVEAGIDRYRSIHLAPSGLSNRTNLFKLLKQIRDYNPDASKAISNMLRLVNSGVTISAVKEDGSTAVPAGQELLDRIIKPFPPMIGKEYGGGVGVLIDMATLTISTQGALAMEIELGEIRSPDPLEDILVINPWVIDWAKNDEGRWVPGIKTGSGFTELNPIQFRYFPTDPEPGDPRGRSPFLAALDMIFFQMEVLRDLKAAAHFAGYPRIDISVAYEAVLNAITATKGDLLKPGKEGDLRDELEGYLNDIADLVDDLEPDDAFIHFDNVKGEYIVPSGKVIDVSQLTTIIDTQVIAGLKQLPVLMGRNTGSTETHATVQWQVFAEELRHIQKLVINALEWAFSVVLRVYGIQAQAKVEFDPVRSISKKADLEAEKVETEVVKMQVNQGWITNDEAALRVVGHAAVGEPISFGAFGEDEQEDAGDDQEEEDQDAPADDDLEEELSRAFDGVPDLGYQIDGMVETDRLLANVGRLPDWMQSRYRMAEEGVADLMANQGARSFDKLLELEDEEARGVSTETPSNGQKEKIG